MYQHMRLVRCNRKLEIVPNFLVHSWVMMGCHSDVIISSGHNNDCSYVFVLSEVTLLTPYCVYLAFPHLYIDFMTV